MNGETPAENEVYKILIVEDNEGDTLLLRKALLWARFPHEVVAFRDGEEALRYLRELENAEAPAPDLVVLDMHLGKVDGPTILAAIRSYSKLSETPIVVLSSAISQGDREIIGRYNVARQITKPTDLDEFLRIGQTVREVLDEIRGRNVSGEIVDG